jgi:uncharacterized membrane protein HdeD (DUF308 family)
MTEGVVRRRTGWDIAIGLLLIIASVVVLGHAVLATAVSVLFLGWMILLSGIALVVAAFFRIRSGGFWSAALGGSVLFVLGLVLLRNPGAAAVTLTLVAGALIFAEGVMRLVSAVQNRSTLDRWLLVISGVISVGLGLFVLLNIIEASYVFLGVLLGVQGLVEGLTLIAVGRLRAAVPAAPAQAPPPATA